MAIESMIHPVHVMWHPTRVRLDADQLELRMALEHAAEDEGSDNVLASADDREEVVEPRTARPEIVLVAGQDMEAQRQFQIDRGLIERIVNRTVIVSDCG